MQDKMTLTVRPTHTRTSALLHLTSVSLVAVAWTAVEVGELSAARQFDFGFAITLAALIATAWATFWGVIEILGLRDSTDAETRSFETTAEAVAFMKERLGLSDAELRAELEKQLAKVSDQ
ncbi:hypothetical protein CcrKarma_gp195 [Caulobacter virus Karma]|uniref:hypothetical protein n=1 Tax=Caulobacter virus Karma TaxID=1211641 RepID=UPI00028A4B23|nr:hypothetical protein CcrKarma_gp195 [Caulobacter virus Karma]AFU87712.1 hypothetical protein CcrKarma_gp195 [Caulobacter virus Karma]